MEDKNDSLTIALLNKMLLKLNGLDERISSLEHLIRGRNPTRDEPDDSEWVKMLRRARDDAIRCGRPYVEIPFYNIPDRDAFEMWFTQKYARTIVRGCVGPRVCGPDGCGTYVVGMFDHPKNMSDFDK